MDELSQVALAILWRAGWTPKRQIDTSDFEKAWCREGIVPSPRALAFIRSFDGLDLVCPHPIIKSGIRNVHFDPEDALAHARSWHVFEDAIRLILTPVGRREEDCATLLMGDDGQIISNGLAAFALVGSTEAGALNSLCEGQSEPQLYPQYVHSLRVFERAPDKLDDWARAALGEAGWIEGREVDSVPTPGDSLSSNDSVKHPAYNFLREFGGLRLTVPRPGTFNDTKTYELGILPSDEVFTPEQCEKLEYEMDQRFAIVGRDTERTEFLLIGDSGGVYLVPKRRRDVLWCVGKSAYDAINGLVNARGGVRV